MNALVALFLVDAVLASASAMIAMNEGHYWMAAFSVVAAPVCVFLAFVSRDVSRQER